MVKVKDTCYRTMKCYLIWVLLVALIVLGCPNPNVEANSFDERQVSLTSTPVPPECSVNATKIDATFFDSDPNFGDLIIKYYDESELMYGLLRSGDTIDIDSIVPDYLEDYTKSNTEISPDGRKTLQIFREFSEDSQISVVIMDVNFSENPIVVDLDLPWFLDEIHWLESENIIVNVAPYEVDRVTYLIISADDGNTQSLEIALPGKMKHGPSLSPDLSKIVYQRSSTYAIWDIERETLVADLESKRPAVVAWSPSGKLLALTETSERPWSYAGPQMNLSLFSGWGEKLNQFESDSPVSGLQWSPNEEFLTFFTGGVTYAGKYGIPLHIVEIENWNVRNLCLPSLVFWSPNSSYFATYADQLYIYDVAATQFYTLDNERPVVGVLGWIALDR